VALAKAHSVVRSITVQTMTFTGKGGKDFKPRETMPLDGAAQAIETATGGAMRAADFFPHTGAHPLCYSVAYFLKDNGGCRSLTDFFTVEELRRMLGHGYLLQPDDSSQELFHRAIDRLWSSGDGAQLLPAIRRLLERLYPAGRTLTQAQRQAMAEDSFLTVYLHSHMDEDTLPDQVPDPEGRLVPACAYNLFYRQKDPRFWRE
ncbi:MAG: hypothetical protein NTW03_09480, partial [Verrucomicrobia bacterium]|nr:hypothetical protein [Verrucomicrobiota bacterium]